MKKFKLMLVAVMAMFGVNAFAALNLTSGAEQTINGITYKVLTCYKTETATNVNTVSAEQNNYTGTTLNIPATIKFSVEGTLDDTTVSAEYEDVEFKVVEIVKFQDLTSLTSATIGTDGVTYVKTIDPNAFKGCTSLKTVEFAQYTPYNDVAANATQIIGAGAFDGTAIETLDLTKTTITVLNKLFEDANGKLKAVKLPATLTEIAASAFQKCGVLSSVDFTLATKLAKIGNYAFDTTPSLTTLDLSKCAALLYFTATGAAGGADVTPFTAGGTTTNDYLTTLTLPTTTKYIGTALKNCKVLATLNLDKTAIEGLVAGSLTGLDALTTLELPASCLTIAATGKTGLTSLKINGAGVATGTGLSLAPTAFTMDKDANSTITLGNIVKWVALTGAAIVIPAGDGSATVTVGDIAATADLSADFALVSGKVSSFTIGAIAATTKDFSAGFFGQAAKITFGGNITDGTKQIIPSATANAALKEIDFGSIAIAAAAFQGAASSTTFGVFDETNAPALEKMSWTPATATAAFEVDVFSSANAQRTTDVKFSTTAAVAALYPATTATNELWDVEFAAPSVTLDPIKVANNGTGSWYYAAYHAAADVKIAAKQGDATVIVYAAYVNSTENTKVYHEQLRIVDGYYFIKGSAVGGVNVIVKSTSDADVVVKSATVTNANDGMPYQADGTSHNKIEYVAGAKLGTEINAMALAGEVIYAVSKITKNNLAWKTVPATASATNWFIIRAPKTASEIAPARLLNVWSDGSEPDDDATAIKTVKSANAENGAIFNLAGQKVNAAYKGVVIKDGKKFIQK